MAFVLRLRLVYIILLDVYSCRHEKLCGTDMKSNSTQLEHASRSRTSNIILELLAERVRCTKSHSEYLLPSQ